MNKQDMDSIYILYNTIKSILSIYEPDKIIVTDSENYEELQDILVDYKYRILEIEQDNINANNENSVS